MKTLSPYYLLLLLMVIALTAKAQLIVVTGKIINENTGGALENVGIFETFSGIGTITNGSGFFSLMLKPGNAEFVISHSGYKNLSRKMVLHSDTTLTLSLAPQINSKLKAKDAEHQKTAEKSEKNN
ncbi:MAG: Cna protein B-type domain [Prolixibacteraceae bacterium]|nr:MAG: Cna protein B-type domain [Prolixibacteraceae bacterium]